MIRLKRGYGFLFFHFQSYCLFFYCHRFDIAIEAPHLKEERKNESFGDICSVYLFFSFSKLIQTDTFVPFGLRTNFGCRLAQCFFLFSRAIGLSFFLKRWLTTKVGTVTNWSFAQYFQSTETNENASINLIWRIWLRSLCRMYKCHFRYFILSLENGFREKNWLPKKM